MKTNNTVILSSIGLVLAIILCTVPANIQAADPPKDGEDVAVSPAFDAFLQKYRDMTVSGVQKRSMQNTQIMGDRPLGLIPRAFDIKHIDRVPVTKENKKLSLQGKPDVQAASGMQQLSATFDWRTQGKVTPVRNQSTCGTCWSFGTLASLESRNWILNNQEYDFSEQNLVCCTDPSFVYLSANRCNAGGWDTEAVDTLIKKGVRVESCNPYNTSTINSEICKNCQTIYKVTGFRTVVETVSGNEALVKEAIYNYGPVEASFYYSSSKVFNGYIIHDPASNVSRNHLISIIGWDDTFNYGGVQGAWIIKNSWGTAAGQGGYYYMTYGSSNLGEVGYFSSVTVSDPNETLYYWDEAGFIASRGYGDNSAWMASIFTATQSGSLINVDFWTTSNNAEYTIYVYNSRFGSLSTSQSGTCAEMGYYSIPLTNPIELNASQKFTIAVKITTPAYNYPLPVERVQSGLYEPPIQTGVSFVRHYDTDVWVDIGQTAQRNVCLRARVKTNSTSQKLIGPAMDSTYTDIASGNYFTLSQFTSEKTGDITELRVWCASSGNVKLAIYADNGGEPGALMSAVNTPASVVSGWNSIAVAPVSVISGSKYWLARNSDSSVIYYKSQQGSQFRYKATSFSSFSFPSSAGSGFSTDMFYNCIAGWGSETVPSTSKIIGPAMDSTYTDIASGNYFTLSQFTSEKTGDITELRVWCASSGNVKLAIYADNGGEPGALMSAVNTPASVVSGWNSIAVAPVSVISGSKYWLARNSDSSVIYYKSQQGSQFRYKATSFSSFSFPSSAGSGFSTDMFYNCIAGWGSETVPSTSKIIGPAMDSTYTDIASGNYFTLSQFTSEKTGDITELRVWCASSGNVKLAIYADNGGEPGALMSAVNTPASVVSGWNSIAVAPVSVISGSKYWLARNSDSSVIYYKSQQGSQFRYKATSFSSFSFPSSAGSGFSTDMFYNCIAGWGN